jgi:hypothetical protein
MKRILFLLMVIIALALALWGAGGSFAQDKDKQDKYAFQIPGGLAFSEVRGYGSWQVVGPSLTEAANASWVFMSSPGNHRSPNSPDSGHRAGARYGQ